MATIIIADAVEAVYSQSYITVLWKLTDYFNVPPQFNYSFASERFHFLDAVWSLSSYINGSGFSGSGNCIGVYVMRNQSNSPTHKLQLVFSILKPDGSAVSSATKDVSFELADVSHGIHNLLTVSELNEKRDEIAPDGVLLVKCTMMLNVVEHVDAALQTPLDKEILGNDFKKLLLSEESTDVTLKVKDREYKAHRAVLAARSRVFAAMMRDGWKEDSTGVIKIKECDPTAFHQFLSYMYSGEVENLSMDFIYSLHTLADMYEMSALKSLCVQFIIDNLSVDSFCDVLSFFEENDEIMRKIVEFYVQNTVVVLDCPKWLQFLTEYPRKANQLLIKAAHVIL